MATLKSILAELGLIKAKISDTELKGKVEALETSVNGELTKAQTDLEAANKTISDLRAQALTDKAAGEKALADLKAEHATALEAAQKKAKADITTALVSQGLDPAQVPATGTEAEPGTKAKTAYETYCGLLEANKPKEAAQYYASNAEAIVKSKK